MRKPHVAGYFYPSSKEELIEKIEWSFLHPFGPGYIPNVSDEQGNIGIISPHAGYDYSGPIAAHSFDALARSGKYDYFVIIGPNHTGLGADISLGSQDYLTPLGTAKIEKDALDILIDQDLEVNDYGHEMEHSVEVEVPFLQYLYGEIKILPIVMLDQSLEAAKRLSEALKKLEGNFTIVASSDFNHYLPLEKLKRYDNIIAKTIIDRDLRALYSYVYSEEFTPCGFGPMATILLTFPGRVELLRLSNSIEIAGGHEGVGYASFKIDKFKEQ